jgi:PTH1 family peptidyl-tRNA hydrolase
MKLIVGLGNPGIAYKQTRHNVGFMVVDEFCKKRHLVPTKKSGFKAMVASNSEIMVIKPQTYMNLSGESVQSVVHFYKIPLKDILVVSDDVTLSFGVLRLRAAGSSGGHNGLKSIEHSLQSQSWARLRVGVDAPTGRQVLEDYVLEPFTGAENEELSSVIDGAVVAVESWLDLGCSKAMNQVNGVKK